MQILASLYDRVGREEYPQAMLALNVDGERYAVMERSRVDSANGTNTQRHAITQNLRKE